MIKIETVELTNSKATVLELSRDTAQRLAQDLIKQVNGDFNGEEFKIEDGHYFKVSVQRIQDHVIEAITYLISVLPKLPEDLRDSVLKDLASGNEQGIWLRYHGVKIDVELGKYETNR